MYVQFLKKKSLENILETVLTDSLDNTKNYEPTKVASNTETEAEQANQLIIQQNLTIQPAEIFQESKEKHKELTEQYYSSVDRFEGSEKDVMMEEDVNDEAKNSGESMENDHEKKKFGE